MGTIVERRRRDGSTAYMAKIILKREGRVAIRDTKTFERRAAASAWIVRRERELREPGAIERARAPGRTLGDAIRTYIAESRREIGRTKAQVLAAIQRHEIADRACAEITSADIVAFATDLAGERSPATVANYVSHLAAVFRVARAAWNFPLDRQAMDDARMVTQRMGVTAKSRERSRRPTLEELDKLLEHFTGRRDGALPMHRVVAFAIFSTRRQEEITRLQWADLDEAHSRIMVRDMKHPGQKIGNDRWVDLTPEALAIVRAMPRQGERIFPFSPDAVSASFTRACAFLGIEDLHFHDLRHEGVSRLFEMGWSIPRVAEVSGHRSWQSLKRYTHIREAGDKYAGWRWLEAVTTPLPGRRPPAAHDGAP